LGIYGKTPTEHFSRDNWFRFLSDKRLEELDFNAIDSKYHRIIAQDEKDKDPPRYVTHEEDGKRTDYGLGKRYVVKYNVGKIVVIGL